MQFIKTSLPILLFLILFLNGVYIETVNRLVPKNPVYTKLQAEIKKVYEENMLLRTQVLQEKSFAVISAKAREMGFTTTKYVVLTGKLQAK